MREIVFRGKHLDTGNWVEGSLLMLGEESWIVVADDGICGWKSFNVDPATVGQYTGLKDKNGERIFEGDILRYSYDYPGSPWLKAEGKTDADIKYHTGDVFWQEWRGTWAVGARVQRHSANQDIFVYCRNPNRVEVIGNIHDNPEWAERGQQ